MHSHDDALGIPAASQDGETGAALRVLDFYGALGHRDPLHAWPRFNGDGGWSAALPRATEPAAAPGTRRAAEGGYRVDGAWPVRPMVAACPWTVVPTVAPAADGLPPAVLLHVVHRKQWEWPDGSEKPAAALVDAFVPEGLTAPAAGPPGGRPSVLLAASTALSLGIAEAALDRVRDAVPPVPAGAEIVAQQAVDLRLAVMTVRQDLHAAVAAYETAEGPRTGGAPGTRGAAGEAGGHAGPEAPVRPGAHGTAVPRPAAGLLAAVRAAASVSRHVTAFAYDLALGAGDAVREEMTGFLRATAPALQHSGRAADLLEAVPETRGATVCAQRTPEG